MSSALMRSLLSAALALLVLAPAADATFPGHNGRIAFSVLEISDPEPCGDSAGHQDCQHSWSNVFTMRPTGGNRLQLTENDSATPAWAGAATWSPDGRRIAYTDNNGGIYVARADGTHRRGVVSGTEATWSPDGRELAFVPYTNDPTGIWRVDVSTGATRQVTAGYDYSPDWSSKGVIAFSRRRTDGTLTSDIYTVRPDASGLKRVTTRHGDCPSWSPDGRQIAFLRDLGRFRRVRLISGAGGRSRAVTRKQRAPGCPVWSPDGHLLAVNGLAPGISLLRPTGKVVRVIGPRAAVVNSWQPLPR